jgi:hypothetical protein
MTGPKTGGRSSEKGNGSGKPYHPSFGTSNLICKVCYLALCAGIAFFLCVIGTFIIWRFWSIGSFVGGLLLYILAGGLIFHVVSVTQKLLTKPYYCNTLMRIGRANMANVLSIDKQVAIISGLAEGSSIRSLERITGVHRDTAGYSRNGSGN